MKRLAFAVGVLALGFAACAPARADFAVVKFELGYCRIWWDTGAKPIGTGWTIVATAPDLRRRLGRARRRGQEGYVQVI